MRCPYCRHPDSRVTDSREQDEGQVIRRRRSCPECGRRFTTLEEATLAVIKRSGVTEPFSRAKVVSGVRRACQGRPVDEDALAQLAQAVEEEIRATGAAEVPSDDVGLAILGPLRALDEVAYLRFASVYQAFSSVEDFEKAILDLRAEHRDFQTSAPPQPDRAHQFEEGPPPMTEAETRTQASAPSYPKKGLRLERVYTTDGRAPVQRGHLGAARRRHDQLARRLDQLRAARRRVPRLLVGQRGQHRHHEVLPRRGGLRRPGVVAAPAHRPGRDEVPAGRRGERLLRLGRRRRDLRARAHLDAAAPGVQLQLAGLVQRRHRVAAAGVAPASSCRSTTRWTRS